jgi:hypothetical protein
MISYRESSVYLGEEGLDKSWQKDFPKNTKCCYCEGNARIACVYFEDIDETVSLLHQNNWPHNSIAIATYLCEKCLKPTSLYNQA